MQAAAGKPVLIEAEAASAVAKAGALPIDDAARAVAAWIEREGMREGGEERVSVPSDPLERSVARLGFAPTVLSGWRVRLNRTFGSRVLENDGGRFRISRKSLLGAKRRRASSTEGQVLQSAT
jgi:hypothetical protein